VCCTLTRGLHTLPITVTLYAITPLKMVALLLLVEVWSCSTKQRGGSSKNTNNYRFLKDRTLWCEPTSSSILCKKVVLRSVPPSLWVLLAHKLVLVYHVNTHLGLEVFMAMNITIKGFWNVSPCRLVTKCHRFGGTKCLIFRLHILKGGNFKGLFVCFCLYLLTCLRFVSLCYFGTFFSPYLFLIFFLL